MKSTQIVVDHIKSLLSPIHPEQPVVEPLPTLSIKEQRLYHTYRTKFPNEFASAINQLLKPYKLYQYDHLTNILTIEQ
jgi:hypothetical protein